jgi:hypothetical protein
MEKGEALVRRNREYWSEVVGEFEKSGLKQRMFCVQRSLHADTFRHWLYQLRREAKAGSSRASRFVPLRPTTRALAAGYQLRVGSVTLSLMELPPAEYIAELARLMDR